MPRADDVCPILWLTTVWCCVCSCSVVTDHNRRCLDSQGCQRIGQCDHIWSMILTTYGSTLVCKWTLACQFSYFSWNDKTNLKEKSYIWIHLVGVHNLCFHIHVAIVSHTIYVKLWSSGDYMVFLKEVEVCCAITVLSPSPNSAEVCTVRWEFRCFPTFCGFGVNFYLIKELESRKLKIACINMPPIISLISFGCFSGDSVFANIIPPHNNNEWRIARSA